MVSVGPWPKNPERLRFNAKAASCRSEAPRSSGAELGCAGLLLLKPNCECCDADLPSDAVDALICSFECTFCADCVESRLPGGNARTAAAILFPDEPARQINLGNFLHHQNGSLRRTLAAKRNELGSITLTPSLFDWN